LTLDTAIVSICEYRVVLAFPDSTLVCPGAGDALIERIMPHFPGRPIMLVTFDDGERAYAPFNFAPIFKALNLDDIFLAEITLDDVVEVEEELPF
jgi:hypothetical protein